MNLVGLEVIHLKMYGEGIITDQTVNKITVSFYSVKEPKIFKYPDIFTSFIRLKDD